MQNNLLLFVQELIQRLFTKSPVFFQIINRISLALILVTGLPGFFEELGINLPDWATVLQNKIIAWSAIVSAIISKLTTQSTPIAVTSSGEVLKKTDEKKLPFTAKSEDKASAKPGGVKSASAETETIRVEKVVK